MGIHTAYRGKDSIHREGKSRGLQHLFGSNEEGVGAPGIQQCNGNEPKGSPGHSNLDSPLIHTPVPI